MRRSRRALLLSIVALGLASATQGQDQPEATEPARLMTVWGSPKTQSSQLRSAAFSRDGKRASCAFERECHVWDIERGRPDSAARDGILHPWDAARGDITAFGADLRIYELARAPKVRRALRFYEARWRPRHGKEETTFLRFRDLKTHFAVRVPIRTKFLPVPERFKIWDDGVGIVGSIAPAATRYDRFVMSEDGKRLLVPGELGLEHWDLENQALLFRASLPAFPYRQEAPEMTNYPRSVEAIAVTTSWTHVLWWKHLADSDRLSLLKLETGEVVNEFEIPRTVDVELALSPDAKRAISGGRDRRVHVWNTETGKEIVSDRHESAMTVMAISPDGRRVLTAADKNTLEVRDLADNEVVLSLGPEGEQGVKAAAIAPDGKTFLACSQDGAVALRELATGATIWSRTLAGASALALFPDGKKALVAGAKGLRRIDVETGKDELTAGNRACFGARTIAFLPDGKRILTVGPWGLALWDVATLTSLAVETHELPAFAVSLDRTRALVARYDGSLELRDTDKLARIKSFEPTDQRTTALAFSPDGTIALQADVGRNIRAWSLDAGFAFASFVSPARYGPVCSLAFLPDGREFLVGTECGYVLRYELLVSPPGAR